MREASAIPTSFAPDPEDLECTPALPHVHENQWRPRRRCWPEATAMRAHARTFSVGGAEGPRA
eukprot:5661488-Pyramimonas_sp.AAC.1